MKTYVVIEIEVLDADVYAEYVARVPATVEQYGGRYLVRGGPVTSLAGDWRPERVVIVEFPSGDHAQRWGASSEYAALAPIRIRSTKTRAIALLGYAPEPV